MAIYQIERIRKKNGERHERELRRKGQRVRIERIALSEPLVAEYLDDAGKSLVTSAIEVYSGEGLAASRLVVQTRNSVYVFRKLEEVA